MTAMFIIFLGIVPILALLFCCWYFCRDRRQRLQIWRKIRGEPKLSLPCVFISALSDKLISLLYKKVKGIRQDPVPPTLPSDNEIPAVHPHIPSFPVSILVKNETHENFRPSRRVMNETFQTSDDAEAEDRKTKRKGRQVQVPVVTIQTEPKTKLKSFGVASERLIMERVEISPVSSPEVRSVSSSPKLTRKPNETLHDMRLWVKDHVSFKLPSLSRNRDGGRPAGSSSLQESLMPSGSITPCSTPTSPIGSSELPSPSLPIKPLFLPNSQTLSANAAQYPIIPLPNSAMSSPPPPPPPLPPSSSSKPRLV